MRSIRIDRSRESRENSVSKDHRYRYRRSNVWQEKYKPMMVLRPRLKAVWIKNAKGIATKIIIPECQASAIKMCCMRDVWNQSSPRVKDVVLQALPAPLHQILLLAPSSGTIKTENNIGNKPKIANTIKNGHGGTARYPLVAIGL
ncbi:hypothetical protein O9929_12575 [Vibrio lentus]|nr:hypothetical protein [Vibrio lentus]